MAFEQNIHATEVFFVLLLLLASYMVWRLKWTAYGFICLVLSLLVGCFVWQSYTSYVLVDADSVRWLSMPVTTLTAAPYSEICRVWVSPVGTWRYAQAFMSGLVFFALLQLVGWLWRKRRLALSGCPTE
ncbi:MAG: hypothetical protein K2W82_19715 [Candidatus Obscuribacterales bacterium]|nr:hypothetical protein [Candidatus Obscuribacterales bacterium]